MKNSFSLAKFDPERFKCDSKDLNGTHVIILIHGFGGTANDLDAYKQMLKILCKNHIFISPSSNTVIVKK